MPTVIERVWDDQRLIAYLLGALPEPEAERLDELSVADDGTAARLRVVEDDLVDAYVSGTLPERLRPAFESFFLASPRRREKVAFARRFLETVDRQPATGPASAPSEPAVLTAWRFAPAEGRGRWAEPRARRLRFVGTAALLVLCSAVLLLRDAGLRRDLVDARQQRAAAERRVTTVEAELERQRAGASLAAGELARLRAAAAPAAFALVLSPQTRGGDTPALHVRPDAQVAIDLRVERGGFERYSAALRDLDANAIVWRSEPAGLRAGQPAPMLSLLLPNGLLQARHYLFELSGRTAGRSEALASYVFHVEAR